MVGRRSFIKIIIRKEVINMLDDPKTKGEEKKEGEGKDD
jgi:hypothetical protein